jgi:hypothetical protein
MQPDIVLKATTNLTIAILIITVLLVLLIALRKELSGEAPFRGAVHLGLAVIGLCTFIALGAAYFRARKLVVPQSNSHRLDTASGSHRVPSLQNSRLGEVKP